MPDHADPPVPVTIIGGYLGAGKTTLVNRLLRSTSQRLTVLVNDFGSSVIDAALVQVRDGDVLQLAGGCVCCQIGDDLVAALGRLGAADREGARGLRPERVVIETSGVAQPAAVATSVALTPGLAVDAVVVVADGGRVGELLTDRYLGDLVAAQLRQADLVLLNRGGGADLAAWTSAPILTDDGDDAVANVLSAEAVGARGAAPLPAAADLFHSFVLHAEGEPAAVLSEVLAVPGLVRAKGFVNAPDGTVHLVQVAGRRSTVAPWRGAAPSEGGVLCIALR